MSRTPIDLAHAHPGRLQRVWTANSSSWPDYYREPLSRRNTNACDKPTTAPTAGRTHLGYERALGRAEGCCRQAGDARAVVPQHPDRPIDRPVALATVMPAGPHPTLPLMDVNDVPEDRVLCQRAD